MAHRDPTGSKLSPNEPKRHLNETQRRKTPRHQKWWMLLSKVGDTPPTQGRPHRRNRKKKDHASPQLLFGLMCDTVVKFGRL